MNRMPPSQPRTTISTILLAGVAVVCAVMAGCADPKKDWELAARDDSPETYLEFLAKHPNAKQADTARQRIEELKVVRSWERAQYKDSPTAYQDFIDKHPDSEFVPAAGDKILVFARDEQWDFTDGSGDKDALTSFIADWPDAPQRAEADAELAEILAVEEAARPKERPGDFRVQLAAFRSAASADKELRRLIGMFPTELLGPVRIDAPAENGTSLFRLQTVPMTTDEAKKLCATLKARNQQCMIINK